MVMFDKKILLHNYYFKIDHWCLHCATYTVTLLHSFEQGCELAALVDKVTQMKLKTFNASRSGLIKVNSLLCADPVSPRVFPE